MIWRVFGAECRSDGDVMYRQAEPDAYPVLVDLTEELARPSLHASRETRTLRRHAPQQDRMITELNATIYPPVAGDRDPVSDAHGEAPQRRS